MKENKTGYLVFSFFLIIGIILFVNPSRSLAVIGKCANCHTMHNSQNGEPNVFNPLDPNAPYERLLKADSCLGCHKSDTSDPFKLDPDNNQVPCVYVPTTDPNNCLAGGNFYYIDNQTDDTLGHNVDVPGINRTVDSILRDKNVPGYTGTWKVSEHPLTCAGSYGCHGTPVNKGTGSVGMWDGIKGAHHGNKTGQVVPDGTSGKGYRFLAGISGYEDPNWQHPDTLDKDHHNEYYGVTTGTDARSMSALCGRCHGKFHQSGDITHQTGRSGPWLRHPTDVSLPNSGEYLNYNKPSGGVREYSVIAPVARTTVYTAPSGTVNPANAADDIVTCLSCHRAHGSDQPDILRWNYNDMVAGGGVSTSGCFICHTSKSGI